MNVIKEMNRNIITQQWVLALISIILLFLAISPKVSFAENINREVRVIVQNSQDLEDKGNRDAHEIIENSLKAGDKYSSEVQKMINTSKEAVRSHDFSNVLPGDVRASQPGRNNSYYRYVFISTSMPKQALKEIFSKATGQNALIVLRGFKENSYQKTYSHFSDLIRDTETGFIIDPELFKTYAISTVPSFIVSLPQECAGSKCVAPAHDRIAGNLTIDYAFDTLSKEGELAKQIEKKDGVQR